MKIENLAYPWKEDFKQLQIEITSLKIEMQNMQNTINNLRIFNQELYDRINIGNSNYNSSPVQRPW